MLALIAAPKEQHVGIVRSRVHDQLVNKMPDTAISVEQFTAAVTNYVNSLAGGPVIQALYSPLGPQIANLDSQGALQAWLTYQMPSAELCIVICCLHIR